MNPTTKERQEWKDDLKEVALQWCVVLLLPLIPLMQAVERFLCRRGLHRPWVTTPNGIVFCRDCEKEFSEEALSALSPQQQ